jgi:hypothetical protein
MKKFFSLAAICISLISNAQQPVTAGQWVVWNSELFLKNGNDSTSYGNPQLLPTLTQLFLNTNNKQQNLISGNNIKTVNSQSILGSGDISITSAVAWGNITGLLASQIDLFNALALKADISGLSTKQDLLLSGTNIKTVNGASVLGSGDLAVTGSGVSRVFLPSDVINNNAVANTIADVTGLSFPVVAGSRYKFRFVIVYSSAATTTGSRWAINGPAATDMSYSSTYPTSATAITNNACLAGYNLPAAANASSQTTSNRCIIEGEILPSANGTVIARFASEIASSAITAVASGRSYVEYQIIN